MPTKPTLNAKRSRLRRGSALIVSFVVLTLVSVAAVSYIDWSTTALRASARSTTEVQVTHLAEAGVQQALIALWRPFARDQDFEEMDSLCAGASEGSPRSAVSGTMPAGGRFASAVVRFHSPAGDTFSRYVTVRSVGWIDQNGNGQLDGSEPNKTIDVTGHFQLARSQVFDYAYFINNYGWMDGFNQTDLIVNGDMRANGNFDFLNGTPTVNGTVIAANNTRLADRNAGRVNQPPLKWTNATYATWIPPAPPRRHGESIPAHAARVAAFQALNLARRRLAYNPVLHGTPGSDAFQQWRDMVFESTGRFDDNRTFGSVVRDVGGTRAWDRTTVSGPISQTVLDSKPSSEVIMPDLSDLNHYRTLSQNWRDGKEFFLDGTPNPNYGRGASLEVWDPDLDDDGGWRRVDTNGVVTGSAIIIGTPSRPIRIRGPVTFTQDVVIKGSVQGQGTIYAGRNVHIVGSVRYTNGPDFRLPEAVNERRDFLGLAARGSVIMGNPSTFGNPYPLAYMTPRNPPTKMVGTVGRYDQDGNWIPPFNAMEIDSTGRRRFQSTFSNAAINSIAEGVNQIDAILYSNFVGGGNVGTGGGGIVLNGTIIARDEAIVTWSLPVIMNYDNRIRERVLSRDPLIDLNLPRSPVVLRSTWQDRGFQLGPSTTADLDQD
jgi:hypothetical protein